MDDLCCEEYKTYFKLFKICILNSGLETINLLDAIPKFKYCPWCGKVRKGN